MQTYAPRTLEFSPPETAPSFQANTPAVQRGSNPCRTRQLKHATWQQPFWDRPKTIRHCPGSGLSKAPTDCKSPAWSCPTTNTPLLGTRAPETSQIGRSPVGTLVTA